jgi:hypothetical protein
MNQTRSVLRFSTVLVLAAFGLPGDAATVDDDFESYAPGSNLHVQGGWKGWDNDSSLGATVSTSFARSGNNSASVHGQTDVVRTFSGVSGGDWVLSLWQYIPSTSTGTGYLILLNEYNDYGPYDWSVQVRNNLDTGKVSSDLSLVGPATLNMVKDAWVEYRFEISLSLNSVAEYYNGDLLSTHPWQIGGLDSIQALDLCGSGPVYYDDMRLAQVPEPAALAFAWLGPAALFALQRRRR